MANIQGNFYIFQEGCANWESFKPVTVNSISVTTVTTL